MNIDNIRSKVKLIILLTTGLVVLILLFRFLADLMIEEDNAIISFIVDVSNNLIRPFADIVNPTVENNFNYDALISLGIYLLLGIAISEVVTSLIHDTVPEIVENIIDALFKLIEFILLLRIIFIFFEVERDSKFVGSIEGLTSWADLFDSSVNLLGGVVNLGMLTVFAIVIVLDIVSGNYIHQFIQNLTRKKKFNIVNSHQNKDPDTFIPTKDEGINVNVTPNQAIFQASLPPAPMQQMPVQQPPVPMPVGQAPAQNVLPPLPAPQPMQPQITPGAMQPQQNVIPANIASQNDLINPGTKITQGNQGYVEYHEGQIIN